MTYCRHCGRALSPQTDVCPSCGEAVEKVKDVIAAEEKRGFWDWFGNVFWYHYKTHVLIITFAALIVGISAYSLITKEKTDFLLMLVSEQPVGDEQAVALTGFWREEVEGVTNIGYSAIFLNGETEYGMAGWSLLAIGRSLDENYSLLIIGESLIPYFQDDLSPFYTAGEMGLAAGPAPELIPLSGSALMEELKYTPEPLYALVKRPAFGKNGSMPPENTVRSELSVACLKALLET